jgi:putative sporulation protein YtxC
MQFISIGVDDCADDIVKQIEDELQVLSERKLKFAIDTVDTGESTSIICSIDNSKILKKKAPATFDALKTYVSSALADYIVGKYDAKLIEKIINCNYFYLNQAEKKIILSNALKIKNNEDRVMINSFMHGRRQNVVMRRLLEYFEESNKIILDGFINFRLKDFKSDLEDIVDRAVDDYLMEKEYKEFLRLLKYFVDIQEPKFNMVHIIAGAKENEYIILNEEENEITNECMEDFINDLPGNELNFDDLLVSTLITLAPRLITIHCVSSFKNKELLETIKNVFANRVLFCSGCSLCNKSFLN